jgi:adenosine deaminase
MDAINNFAELHIHIEGTAEPEFLLDLERRNSKNPNLDESALLSNAFGVKTLDEFKTLYNFQDLQDFLNLYYSCMKSLKNKNDYADLANRYLERVSNTGIISTEAFFDPQTHEKNGNDFATVFEGLSSSFLNAKERYGIDAHLIMCFERDLGVDAASKQLDEALEYLDSATPAARRVLIGVGLDSAEANFEPHPFASVYARAKAAGLHLVAHAGEEGGPDYIRQALDDLGVERIDHGVRALEDKALLKRLASEQIPLTVCPLSNYALKVKENLQETADTVLELLDAGVLVTINSDDPAYFGGYIDDNFRMLAKHGINDDAIAQLKGNSLNARFV